MPIMAKATGTDFFPCPSGAHAAVCVDVVDLGVLEVTYSGTTKKQHKVRVVWQIEDLNPAGKPYNAVKRYTLSLHEKAALRKDLESWRGKAFTPAELEGFDVEVLVGAPALINVVQSQNGNNTYANVAAVMRLPKGMEAPTIRSYTRFVDRQTEAQPDGPPLSDFGGIEESDVPF